MNQFTTIAEVDRIATSKDPVHRNYQITQSYHDLSLALSKRLGSCANWCTFATWASRQAGQTIRDEDFSHALETRLHANPAFSQAISDIMHGVLLKGAARLDKNRITKLAWEALNPTAAMDRASDAVARGNQKVYAEIGREFARFIETCLNDSAYQEDTITGFCAVLRPGDPPDGQRYLKQAFTRYYQAFYEPDQKKKAEMILTSNIEIGFHEQTRLQPEIQEAMEASVIDGKQVKQYLINALFPNQGWMNSIGDIYTSLFNRPTPLDKAISAFTNTARHQIRLFLSAHLMELGFPKGLQLHLGKDLKANFPVHLQKLTYTDLVTLLKKIDPTPDSLADTGAIDWADLYDRLHFIADLFRCYQETPALVTEPPFGTPDS